MKQCPACGKSLNDDAVFCIYCGARTDAPPPAEEPPRQVVCARCGAKLGPGVNFCGACGMPVGVPGEMPGAPFEPQAADAPPFSQDMSMPPYPADGGFAPPDMGAPGRPPRNKKTWLAVTAAVAALALMAGGFFAYRSISQSIRCRNLLESAAESLSKGSYDAAANYYREYLTLREGDPPASIELAKLRMRQGDFEAARRVLSEAEITGGDELYDEFLRVKQASSFEPRLEQLDTDSFPNVSAVFACGMTDASLAPRVTVEENGQSRPVQSSWDNGTLSISYEAQDTENSDEARSVRFLFSTEYFDVESGTDYRTPHFEPATVQLVSTDVTDYPTVRLYFRVENAYNGETVQGLGAKSFIIRERGSGGAYLQREVRSAMPLKGNVGLNIDLVADKSDSISDYDMGKIKSVMTGFVNDLHYSEGDKAELLAFDSIVQQMCYYTNSSYLLVNGINNMSTDGMTALYDALYDGVNHAALQGGARCVIAFTDGMDNVSRHNSEEVVRYANDMQVPVYIVGVGYDVSESVLKSIAQRTGGRYWFIDDLYDLSEIFNEIYAEQKDLYAVEYVSDSSLDAYTERAVDVSVSGGGYKGEQQTSFSPVHSVGAQHHASRYELIKEPATWEEAARRCQERGGHLATITSQSEMDQLIAMAEAQGVRFVWLGGYTSYDSYGNVFGHWITGEDFSFQPWSPGEPSRLDQDGTPEWYIMLWNVEKLGGWSWNDQRNDPAAVTSMGPDMGYICEYEN